MKKILLLSMLLFWAYPVLVSAQVEVTSSPDSTNLSLARTRTDAWLGKDKADHFMVSAVLTGAQYYVLRGELEASHRNSLLAAMGGSFALGIAKEIYDGATGKGTASAKDLIADALGIAVAAVLLAK